MIYILYYSLCNINMKLFSKLFESFVVFAMWSVISVATKYIHSNTGIFQIYAIICLHQMLMVSAIWSNITVVHFINFYPIFFFSLWLLVLLSFSHNYRMIHSLIQIDLWIVQKFNFRKNFVVNLSKIYFQCI